MARSGGSVGLGANVGLVAEGITYGTFYTAGETPRAPRAPS